MTNEPSSFTNCHIVFCFHVLNFSTSYTVGDVAVTGLTSLPSSITFSGLSTTIFELAELLTCVLFSATVLFMAVVEASAFTCSWLLIACTVTSETTWSLIPGVEVSVITPNKIPIVINPLTIESIFSGIYWPNPKFFNNSNTALTRLILPESQHTSLRRCPQT